MAKRTRVVFTREPDDPICQIRASLGGGPDFGYYCVSRGTRDDLVALLTRVLEALHNHEDDRQVPDGQVRP